MLEIRNLILNEEIFLAEMSELMANKQKKRDTQQKAQRAADAGFEAFNERRYEEAIQLFTDAISYQLTNINYYIYRSLCYYFQNQIHRYVFDLTLGLHIEPCNYALLMARAHGFFLLSQYKQSIQDLDAALELYKQTAPNANAQVIPGNICFRRGCAHFMEHDYQKAADDYSVAILAQPQNSTPFSRRGTCLLQLQQFDQALEDFQSAVACSSAAENQHLNYFKLGQAYLITDNKQEAVMAFNSAITTAVPIQSEEKLSKTKTKKTLNKDLDKLEVIQVNGVNCKILKFTIDESRDLYNNPVEIGKDNKYPQYYANMGKAQALLGEYEKALYNFSLSIDYSFDTNNPNTLYERSTAYRIMGRYDEALSDITLCSRRLLNSDVAFNKAIIIENQGNGDNALDIYECILKGAFNKSFSVEYLEKAGEGGRDIIDYIVEQQKLQLQTDLEKLEAAKKQVQYEHLETMYHCALLHRQKMNFKRAITLISLCCSMDEKDFRMRDLLGLLYLDALNYEDAIINLEKSEQLQNHLKIKTGVSWETYYLRALAKMKLLLFNSALSDLILAQSRPAGGNSRDLKRSEIEMIIDKLDWLPPGAPIQIAYYIAQKIPAVPRDPLAPKSAARGTQNENQFVQQLLDLSGCLPGSVNELVFYRKAECLFQLHDYIGCIRSLSIVLQDYQFDATTKNGKREISQLFSIYRDKSTVAAFRRNYEQEQRNNQQKMNQSTDRKNQYQVIDVSYQTDAERNQQFVELMLDKIQVELNKAEVENLFNIYFLRARALAALNRMPHALKDCGKAHYVKICSEIGYDKSAERNLETTQQLDAFRQSQMLQNEDDSTIPKCSRLQKRRLEKPIKGIGHLYYFMAKIYSNLRMYTKAHHLSRDAIISGVPYYAIHRVYYFQGICLCYCERLQDAAKAFTMALKSEFAARCADKMREIESFRTGVIQLPTLEEVSAFAEKYPNFLTELKVQLPELKKFIQKKHEVFELAFRDDSGFVLGADLHRLHREPCMPESENDVEKIQKYSEIKKKLIKQSYVDSKLFKVDNKVSIFDDFLLATNKDIQIIETAQSQTYTLLQNPRSWLTSENAFYLHERAKCLQELGFLEQACDDFTSVIRIQKNNPRLFFRRAFALKNLGMFDQSALDFKQSQSLDPLNGKFKVDYSLLGNIGFIEIVPHGHEEFYLQASDWKRQIENNSYVMNKQYFEVNNHVGQLNDLEFMSLSEQQVFDMLNAIGTIHTGQTENVSVNSDSKEKFDDFLIDGEKV